MENRPFQQFAYVQKAFKFVTDSFCGGDLAAKEAGVRYGKRVNH